MSFSLVEDISNKQSGYSVNGNSSRTFVCRASIIYNYKDYLPITLTAFSMNAVSLGNSSNYNLSISSQTNWTVADNTKIDGVSINYKKNVTIQNRSNSSYGVYLNCKGTMTFADYTYTPKLTAEFINLLCRLWPQGGYSNGSCNWGYTAVGAGEKISRSTLTTKFNNLGWYPSIDSTKPLESDATNWYHQIIAGQHVYYGSNGHSPLRLFVFDISTS